MPDNNPGETPPEPACSDSPAGGSRGFQDWACRRTSALAAQIRPQVSLGAGSVFVLLTLFLPIAYSACGPNNKGAEYLMGAGGYWPGLMTLLSGPVARVMYAVAVALAVSTLGFLLLSAAFRSATRSPRLLRAFLAASGALSLYYSVDLFWIFMGGNFGSFLEKLVGSEDALVGATAGVTILILMLCLRNNFLRRQRWIVALSGAATIASVLVLAELFLSALSPRTFLSESFVSWMVVSPAYYLWIVPLVFWVQFGFSQQEDIRRQWPGVRRRIVQVFLVILAANCSLLPQLVREKLWGYPVFFLGLHLIWLGHAQLARLASPRRET